MNAKQKLHQVHLQEFTVYIVDISFIGSIFAFFIFSILYNLHKVRWLF